MFFSIGGSDLTIRRGGASRGFIGSCTASWGTDKKGKGRSLKKQALERIPLVQENNNQHIPIRMLIRFRNR